MIFILKCRCSTFALFNSVKNLHAASLRRSLPSSLHLHHHLYMIISFLVPYLSPRSRSIHTTFEGSVSLVSSLCSSHLRWQSNKVVELRWSLEMKVRKTPSPC